MAVTMRQLRIKLNFTNCPAAKRGNVLSARQSSSISSLPRSLSRDIHSNDSQSQFTDSILFLHGILGSKRNWRTVSREFIRRHNCYTAVTMDLRGHGASPTLDEHGEHTVDACAIDVMHTLDTLDTEPSILCGHSFSGKVVLKCLEHRYNNEMSIPAHTWVLDSLPGKYKDDPTGENSVSRILSTVYDLPQREFVSKEWIVDYLLQQGFPKPVVLWIATNLVPVDQSSRTIEDSPCKFSFDIDTVVELFDDFCAQDVWGFLEEYDGPGKIHYLRAGRNSGWSEDVLKRFEYICSKNHNIQLHTMPHVGHWLHTEDLHGMIDVISKKSRLDDFSM